MMRARGQLWWLILAGTIPGWALAQEEENLGAGEPEITSDILAGPDLRDVVNALGGALRKLTGVATASKLTEEEIAEILSDGEFEAERRFIQVMDVPFRQVLAHIGLDEQRRTRLKEAKEATVKAMLEDWRQEMRKKIPLWSDDHRQQLAMGHLAPIGGPPDPEKQEIWKRAIGDILTEEERQMLDSRIARSRRRRAEALMLLFIAEAERHLGFTEDQRETLLAEGTPHFLGQDEPVSGLIGGLFDPFGNFRNASIDLGQILEAVKRDPEIASALTGTQRKRWESLEAQDFQRGYSSWRSLTSDGDVPEVATEVEAESVLAALLFEAAKRQRQSFKSQMETRLELICRLGQVSDETKTKLTTLSKGTVESLAEPASEQLNAYLRRQWVGTDPNRMLRRLTEISLPDYSLERYSRGRKSLPSLWTDGLKRILDEEHRASVDAYGQAVTQWRRRASAAIVLTDIEQFTSLSDFSRDSLQARLLHIVEDFEPELDQTFSFGWLSRPDYRCMPLELLGEERLEEFFDEEQIELLRGSCLARTGPFAAQIWRQRSHRGHTPPKLLVPSRL